MDQKGNKRNYPWYVEIQNGAGVSVRNANGGRYCKFEMEYTFRQNRIGNFANLLHLLNMEIQKVGDLVQVYGEGDGLRKVS